MNSLYIVFAVILLVVVLYPKITISENQIYSPLSQKSDALSTPRIYDFYIPQLTNNQTPLSSDKFNNQMNANMLTRNTYLNDDNMNIIRKELNDIGNKYPKYILKDTLSGNTIGNSELSPFHKKENKPYTSFTDENVSQYPKYYNSDIKNELTNVGKFFDKKNKYSDTTTANGSAYVDDNCYIDSDNNITCLENTRLQNIPPKNYNEYETCDIMKSINNIKINDSKDTVMNGLSFYDNVFGSKAKNETFSPFVDSSVKECFVDV
tara:strand:- start:1705 stop:2496 length:792 start_codon:yes stop_codon:yes gene_type:complete